MVAFCQITVKIYLVHPIYRSILPDNCSSQVSCSLPNTNYLMTIHIYIKPY